MKPILENKKQAYFHLNEESDLIKFESGKKFSGYLKQINGEPTPVFYNLGLDTSDEIPLNGSLLKFKFYEGQFLNVLVSKQGLAKLLTRGCGEISMKQANGEEVSVYSLMSSNCLSQ